MWWLLGGALAGGAMNIWSTSRQREEEQAELRRQKAMEKAAFNYQQNYQQSLFDQASLEAWETAGIQKNRLAQALGADVEGFNLSLEGQALQNQAARIGLADSVGGALAAQGASGTRGSDSLQMRIDYEENALSRQLDLQNQGNSMALGNMVRQYTIDFDDIGREIASWHSGGYRYETNQLEKQYAEQMHGLKMKGYDAEIDAAGMSWQDVLFSGFGGAATGAQFGSGVKRWWDQLG
jgi:hypothetical protein